jgi:predicted ATPase
LIRDALYESLLSESRATLHLKVAEQIELRSANRLDEVAEVLAHHYGRTARADKAFRYPGLAGRKSLDRYSVDEAQKISPPSFDLVRIQAGLCRQRYRCDGLGRHAGSFIS